ncbi:MAG TPA: YfhO family protein [Actinomycetota bacterium]|nr:YfhO family protein [Actinomycetota bacterium]
MRADQTAPATAPDTRPAGDPTPTGPASEAGRNKPTRRLTPVRWLRWLWPVVLAPLLLFGNGVLGRVAYAPGDGTGLFMPWFIVSARAWASGHLPTWDPWAQGGMPHLGSAQAAALYPPNLLFLVAPPIVANNLGIVATFLLAGIGAWLLARLLCEDEVAAAVGGLGFALSAFMFAHIGHQSVIAAAAWLPWMIYGYERLIRRATALRLLLLALVIALALLAGSDQVFFTELLILAVYAVTVALAGRPRRPLQSAGLAILGVAAGLGLAAVQLLPTIAVAGISVRTAKSFAFSMSYSLPKSHIPLLLFPYLFGALGAPGEPYNHIYSGMWNPTELSGYAGAALVVLAAAGLVAMRKHRPARAMGAVAVVCFVLALGPGTPVSHLVFRLPVYGAFRAWARYVVGLDFAAAMLAAYGVAAVRRGARGERRAAVILAGLATGAVLLAAVTVPRFASVRRFIPGSTPALSALAIPCAFAVAGLVCVFLLLRTRRAGALAAIVVVSLDLVLSFGWWYQWRFVSPPPAQLAAQLSPTTPMQWGGVSATAGGISRYMFVGSNVVPIGQDWVHISDAKQMRSVNASNSLMPADYATAVGLTPWGAAYYTDDLWRPGSRVFDLLRVSTVIREPGSSGAGPGPGSLLVGGRPVVVSASTLVRYDYTPRLADAYLVGATQDMPFSEEMNAIHGVHPFDPAATALLDASCPACPTGPPGPAGKVTSTTWGTTTVDLSIETTRPAMLVVSQAWSPGWVATIDGRTVPVVRVDGLVQGVPVPAGARRVSLSYHAPGLRLGFLVTLLTVAALGVPTAVGTARRRVKRRSAA